MMDISLPKANSPYVEKWDNVLSSVDTVVCLGNFDGVHIGHQSIFTHLLQKGRQTGLKPVVVTYHPHPQRLFKSSADFQLITTSLEKRMLIEQNFKLDCHVIQFDRDFSLLEPETFLHLFLEGRLRAKALVLGPNHHFGKHAKGDIDFFKNNLPDAASQLEVVPFVEVQGNCVSSTLIRRLLQNGELTQANKYLGYPFFYAGEVVKGEGRGRQLGFPTLNIKPHEDKILVARGVYAASVVFDNNRYPALVNVGINPTFQGHETKIEAHILDFHQDIYGQKVRLELNLLLRKEERFKSAGDLIQQIHKDIVTLKEVLK